MTAAPDCKARPTIKYRRHTHTVQQQLHLQTPCSTPLLEHETRACHTQPSHPSPSTHHDHHYHTQLGTAGPFTLMPGCT